LIPQVGDEDLCLEAQPLVMTAEGYGETKTSYLRFTVLA
jgi:hypothetical protein